MLFYYVKKGKQVGFKNYIEFLKGVSNVHKITEAELTSTPYRDEKKKKLNSL